MGFRIWNDVHFKCLDNKCGIENFGMNSNFPFLSELVGFVNSYIWFQDSLMSHLIGRIGLVHFEVPYPPSCLPNPNLWHQLHQILILLPPKKFSLFSQTFKLSYLKLLQSSKKFLIFKMQIRNSRKKSGQKMLQFLHLQASSKKLSRFSTTLWMITRIIAIQNSPSQKMLQKILQPPLWHLSWSFLIYCHIFIGCACLNQQLIDSLMEGIFTFL